MERYKHTFNESLDVRVEAERIYHTLDHLIPYKQDLRRNFHEEIEGGNFEFSTRLRGVFNLLAVEYQPTTPGKIDIKFDIQSDLTIEKIHQILKPTSST